MKKIVQLIFIQITFILGYHSHLSAQCPAVPSPYTENFGGASLPSCWQQSATSGVDGNLQEHLVMQQQIMVDQLDLLLG